jgi:hypothetical protein
LRSIVAIRRYAQIAHAVGFDAVIHDLASLRWRAE